MTARRETRRAATANSLPFGTVLDLMQNALTDETRTFFSTPLPPPPGSDGPGAPLGTVALPDFVAYFSSLADREDAMHTALFRGAIPPAQRSGGGGRAARGASVTMDQSVLHVGSDAGGGTAASPPLVLESSFGSTTLLDNLALSMSRTIPALQSSGNVLELSVSARPPHQQQQQHTSQALYRRLTPQQYLHVKRELFSYFFDIDKDDDGYVSFEDVVDFLLFQRSLSSEMAKELKFEVRESVALSAAERGSKSSHGSHARHSSHRPTGSSSSLGDDPHGEGGEDDEPDLVIPYESATGMKAATGPLRPEGGSGAVGIHNKGRQNRLQRLVALFGGPQNDIAFLDESLQIQERIVCSNGLLRGSYQSSSLQVLDVDVVGRDELVVSSHVDRVLRVWTTRDAKGIQRTSTWRMAFQHDCGGTLLTTVRAQPNSDRVFTGGSKGEMLLWRLSNERIGAFHRGDANAFSSVLTSVYPKGMVHSDAVKCIVPFESSKRFASCALDQRAVVWDWDHDVAVQAFPHSFGLLTLAVSEPRSLLATAGYSADIALWDYSTKLRLPNTLRDDNTPHQGCVTSLNLLTHNGAPILSSVDSRGKLKMWDLRMMKCVQTLALHGAHEGGANHHSVSGIATAPMATKLGAMNGTIACQSPWGPLWGFSGQGVSVVSETTEMQPKQMYFVPSTGTCYDLQSGSLVSLHEDALVVWVNGAQRQVVHTSKVLIEASSVARAAEKKGHHRSGAAESHERGATHRKVEEARKARIRCITAFPKGRQLAVGTTAGDVVVMSLLGDVQQSYATRESGLRGPFAGNPNDMAVTQILVGSYEMRPFLTTLTGDGTLRTFMHPTIAMHAALPSSVPSTIALGSADGVVWVGATDGAIYQVDLPEAVGSPILARVSTGAAIVGLSLLPQQNVVACLAADGVLFFVNENSGEKLVELPDDATYFPPAADAVVRQGSWGKFLAAVEDPRREESFLHITTTSPVYTLAVGSDQSPDIRFLSVHPTVVSPDALVASHSITVRAPVNLGSCRGGVTNIQPLPLWNAFCVTTEDGMGIVVSASGTLLAYLSQQLTAVAPWPRDTLPPITTSDKSRNTISIVHKFFSILKRQAQKRKNPQKFAQERTAGYGSFIRRSSRALSLHRPSDAVKEPTSVAESDPLAIVTPSPARVTVFPPPPSSSVFSPDQPQPSPGLMMLSLQQSSLNQQQAQQLLGASYTFTDDSQEATPRNPPDAAPPTCAPTPSEAALLLSASQQGKASSLVSIPGEAATNNNNSRNPQKSERPSSARSTSNISFVRNDAEPAGAMTPKMLGGSISLLKDPAVVVQQRATTPRSPLQHKASSNVTFLTVPFSSSSAAAHENTQQQQQQPSTTMTTVVVGRGGAGGSSSSRPSFSFDAPLSFGQQQQQQSQRFDAFSASMTIGDATEASSSINAPASGPRKPIRYTKGTIPLPSGPLHNPSAPLYTGSPRGAPCTATGEREGGGTTPRTTRPHTAGSQRGPSVADPSTVAGIEDRYTIRLKTSLQQAHPISTSLLPGEGRLHNEQRETKGKVSDALLRFTGQMAVLAAGNPYHDDKEGAAERNSKTDRTKLMATTEVSARIGLRAVVQSLEQKERDLLRDKQIASDQHSKLSRPISAPAVPKKYAMASCSPRTKVPSGAVALSARQAAVMVPAPPPSSASTTHVTHHNHHLRGLQQSATTDGLVFVAPAPRRTTR